MLDNVQLWPCLGLRWVGHDEKCFRFEILGCTWPESEASSNISAVATSHGYIHVSWLSPNVSIASDQDQDLTLDSRYYSVALTDVDTDKVVIY